MSLLSFRRLIYYQLIYIFLSLSVCITIQAYNILDSYVNFEKVLFDDTVEFYFESNTNKSLHTNKQFDKKNWTFIVYIAADNDLRCFAANNIKQMASIGSNEHLNILVHLDIRITGDQKITRRYYIEKNKIMHATTFHDVAMDSGNPKTLISCCKWAIENYPANNYALILWNHGTGIIDPENTKIVNPAELFYFNPRTNKLELDRSIGFFDFIQRSEQNQRGICWDSTSGNYLTNKKLDYALNEIQRNILNGKKFSIIGFDACLMSMLEIASIIKKYADFMVGSQEVELGTGWDYSKSLAPFLHNTINKETFAQHIVEVYANSYSIITNDFTQSALDLTHITQLEENLNTIANLLVECFKYQKNNSVKNAIKISRNRQLCTHFDEPSYIDLHHFYTNMQNNLKYFSFNQETHHGHLRKKLHEALNIGKQLINHIVVANKVGKNLQLAKGLSVYFPERRIHSSYTYNHTWLTFLEQYIHTK